MRINTILKSGFLAGVLAMAAVVQPAIAAQKVNEADVVYKNGFVYTVDDFMTTAQAFAVRDGKFLVVGSDDDM